MRLSKLKMAGFKSFVDPTAIQFPSDLTGVVGPNGCGKSNIIDAVRLVMGETSRHLRGESMEDVIFNGSTGRKPVGQASVELIFDNSDGSLGGEYAQYAEISLRRVVSRDGTSKYYLNGAHCRRKDIVDLFLGTGLGPNSYAIIGQGMISRLVQAKPEDLKAYLEEAAGVSKYKERRRETENRISHSRENLSRLEDVSNEVEQQLEKLKRQSKAAERFQDLRQRQTELKTQALGMRFRDFRIEAEQRDAARAEGETRLAALQVRLSELEAALEQARGRREAAAVVLGDAQAKQYQASADKSRHEQALRTVSDQIRRQQDDLQSLLEAKTKIGAEQTQEEATAADTRHALTAAEPALAEARQRHESARAALAESESAMSAWQDAWTQGSRSLAEARRIHDLASAQIAHLQREIGNIEEQRERLQRVITAAADESLRTEESQLRQEHEQGLVDAAQIDAQFQATAAAIASLRQRQQSLGQEMDIERRRGQDLRGRLSSLKTLQDSALHAEERGLPEWLARNGLADAPRLAQRLIADSGWDKAAEAVLGERLEAVCVPSIEEACANEKPPAKTVLFEPVAVPESVVSPYSLHHKLRSPWPLDGWLANVYVAPNMEHAMALRRTLGEHESVVTADGDWISRRWMKVAGSGYSGVLAREQEIKGAADALAESDERLQAMQAELVALNESVTSTERERSRLQGLRDQSTRRVASAAARLAQVGVSLKQLQDQAAAAARDLARLDERLAGARQSLEQQGLAREHALGELQQYQVDTANLESEREALRQRLSDARAHAQSCADSAQQQALKLQALKSRIDAADMAVRRLSERTVELDGRIERLRSAVAESEQAQILARQTHDEAIAVHAQTEQILRDARQGLAEIDSELAGVDAERQRAKLEFEQARSNLDELRMAWQEISARINALTEQAVELGLDLEQAIASLPEDAILAAITQELTDIEARIARLGPINLAAIDEHKALSERKTYLDAQHADLSEALTTLEDAMRKIDRETRTRFDDVFTRVNSKLEESFTQLFGGGAARLEVLTDEQGVGGGVAIIARPPGKTAKSINLLSGGEQTLTAVALVFAIFSLNPAPFCLLDEADAALDEANVGRFCELVKAMSQTVQFIVITHNKTTMEYAHQLVGVTMQEPGVSRLVAVDIDQALRMTEEKTVRMAAVG